MGIVLHSSMQCDIFWVVSIVVGSCILLWCSFFAFWPSFVTREKLPLWLMHYVHESIRGIVGSIVATVIAVGEELKDGG